ncbi:hypothetical protein WA158_003592 [Blastocystis sp. Blastoise]
MSLYESSKLMPKIVAYGFPSIYTEEMVHTILSTYGTVLSIDLINTESIQLTLNPITDQSIYFQFKTVPNTYLLYMDDIQMENKIFMGMIPSMITENDIYTLLLVYGDIEELVLVKDPMTHLSKGCCFCRYKERISALKAIYSLNGQFRFPYGKQTVIVRFADTFKQRYIKHNKDQPSSPTSITATFPANSNTYSTNTINHNSNTNNNYTYSTQTPFPSPSPLFSSSSYIHPLRPFSSTIYIPSYPTSYIPSSSTICDPFLYSHSFLPYYADQYHDYIPEPLFTEHKSTSSNSTIIPSSFFNFLSPPSPPSPLYTSLYKQNDFISKENIKIDEEQGVAEEEEEEEEDINLIQYPYAILSMSSESEP